MSRYIPRSKKEAAAQIPNQISVYFHQSNLEKIQEELGKECTYVSHARYDRKTLKEVEVEGKDGNMIKRNVLVKSPEHYVVAKFKKNKPIRAVLNGTPNDIKSEYYSQLRKDLVDAARRKGIISDS